MARKFRLPFSMGLGKGRTLRKTQELLGPNLTGQGPEIETHVLPVFLNNLGKIGNSDQIRIGIKGYAGDARLYPIKGQKDDLFPFFCKIDFILIYTIYWQVNMVIS